MTNKTVFLQPGGGFDKVIIGTSEHAAPAAGEISVRLRASSLNYHDYVVVSGVWGPVEQRIDLFFTASEVTGDPVYLNMVRARVGLPGFGQPGYPEQYNTLELALEHERRVELSFEEHRFFDVRRWKLGEEYFNKPVTGVKITGEEAPFTYSYYTAQNRTFSDKMYRFPFAQTQLAKAPALEQNPGW